MVPIEQVKSLFHQALELPQEADRSAWLEARCQGNLALLRELQSLLDARTAMGSATAGPTPRPAGIPRARFGAYRAVELLARGGMSTVYRGERCDGHFHQTVAVKILAGYLAGGEFLSRFETERRLLASLNHDHITRLLDGGVSSAGDPYLITEYVEGQTIDRYCDLRKLPVEARLRVFLQVCDAVDYAHRNLIVHRDLKPGNILVNTSGAVKLLDFGTASLLETGQDATVTRARMLTPRYASPEQLRGERVSTATDIYSLGVVLYEMLTGAWPFGNPDSVLRGWSRVASDVPAKSPSTVVTPQSAAERSVSRPQLSRMLRGDLAPMVMKALESDPARRYESVRQFATDLENYLAGRPVLARPQTVFYRTGKFLRRRWPIVTAAAVFVLGLSTATVVAIRQAGVARAEAAKSEKVSQFLKDVLSSGTRTGPDTTILQMLTAAEPQLEQGWKDDPLTEAALRLNLGASYTTLQQPERAQRQIRLALGISLSRGDYRSAAVAQWILALNERVAGHLGISTNLFEQSLASLKRLGKRAPPLWNFRVKRDFGTVLVEVSNRRLHEAHTLLEEAIAEGLRDASVPGTELGNAQAQLGIVLAAEGRDGDAAAVFQQASATWQRQNTDGGVQGRAIVLRGQVEMSKRQQNFAAAANFARQENDLLQRDPQYRQQEIALAQNSLEWARLRAETGETAEAVAQVQQAIPVVRKYWSHGNDWLWFPLTAASHVLVSAGRFAEAERYARESLLVRDEAHREQSDPWLAESLEVLGAALMGEKKHGDAVAALERSEKIYSGLGPAWARTAQRVRTFRENIH